MKTVRLIAFEYLPYLGGQATYANEMINSLLANGYKVVVYAPNYSDDQPHSLGQFELIRIFNHQSISFKAMIKFVAHLMTFSKSDVLLACDIRAGLLVSMSCSLLGRSYKSILMFHGGEILHASRSYLWRLVNKFAASRFNSLVANSRYSATMVEKYLVRSCSSIPLGVSSFWFEAPDLDYDNNVLSEIKKSGRKVISLVGRLERRKGHLRLLEIMRREKIFENYDVAVVFSGRVVERDYAAEVMAAVEQTAGSSYYVGSISSNDLRKLYSDSYIFFMPATTQPHHVEGFGLVFLEAAAQGCPSISTRVGGISDAIIDGETGLLFNEDDDSIISAIHMLLNNESERNRLGRAARFRASKMTWKETCASTISLVDD